MAQNPLAVTIAKTTTGSQSTVLLDSKGNLPVHSAECVNSSLNITAGVILLKSTAGKVGKIIVNTAGSAPGSVSDCSTTGAVAAGNLIFTIPNTVGTYPLNFPAKVGIVITAGTGQVLSVSFD